MFTNKLKVIWQTSLFVFFYIRICNGEFSPKLGGMAVQFSSVQGSITDIPNIWVGHSARLERPTGCTVIVCNTSCVAGVDVRGSDPGTRETDLLDPINGISNVNAVLLTGGSSFGLDAESGVVQCLVEKKIGLPDYYRPIPVVPAAILYDLGIGKDPMWFLMQK